MPGVQEMRRLVFLLLAIPMLFSCGKAEVDDEGLSIVAVNFPSYDAARAVLGNTEGLVMLLPPGTESHSYDPTPKDMVRIADSDLIIYTGGHSDAVGVRYSAPCSTSAATSPQWCMPPRPSTASPNLKTENRRRRRLRYTLNPPRA